MLKLTGVEIALVYDQEMIEKGLRGGMTQTTCKKVEANNKYVEDDYDESTENSYSNYFDANDLSLCNDTRTALQKFEVGY